MHLGADYYPEQWVYPYAGTEDAPESRWEDDAALMAHAGLNVVRMGEFSWALCEPEDGKFNFAWLQRAMDVLGKHEIKVVLGTPTAAPPLWLTQKHPGILPLDENGQVRHEGTRRACCLNSNAYWDHSRKLVTAMAEALGKHPQLIAWQIDAGIGRHQTEYSFNAETKRDWHDWLKAKYETVENLNLALGLRVWGQTVNDFAQVPMPMTAPAAHSPALLTDWRRFSSDTCVAFVRMQAELLRQFTPNLPVTTTLRPFAANFDYFDMAENLDFVSMDNDAPAPTKAAEVAFHLDFLRSLKKQNLKLPDGETEGFWVMEQKAGSSSWGDVNSLIRPGITRLFTYQLLSRGANGVLYFYWRSPRIGPEKFHGGILTHDGLGKNRMFQEIAQIGAEVEVLSDALKGTKVHAEVAILYNHVNDWALDQPLRPNKYFSQKEHVQLFHAALHDKNVPVDFARPTDDLSQYKLIIAPSLHLLSGGDADLLRVYVEHGGTLISTFNTALVNEHHLAPDTGWPGELTDVFGLEVHEFDPLPPGEENHLTFKAGFPTTHLHSARLWCDLIEPKGCEILATYAQDFYAGKPAITINTYGDGKAVYIGTMCQLSFYLDLVAWARQLCGLVPLLRVPDQVEVSLRSSADRRIYFLLNHNHSPIRIQLYKPLHDLLTNHTITGNHDMPPHGVLVLDEPIEPKA